MAEVTSPGGFVFGIQGYEYGEVRPRSITFFLDGTTKVSDHRGNAIREYSGSHREVVAALKDAGVDWQTLDWAGWPQLPYDELQKLTRPPETPFEALLKIKDKDLRQDALKYRRELDTLKEVEELASMAGV